MEKTDTLCEIIGIILGDGYLHYDTDNYKYGFNISLNGVDDYDYYQYVKKLLSDFFQKKLSEFWYRDLKNAQGDEKGVTISLYGKEIFYMLLEKGLIPGDKIFISYSTADSKRFHIREFAKSLQTYLDIDEVLMWEEDSKNNIISFMNENLEKCDILLLFCTANSINSKPVILEWSAFLAADKRIIPIFKDIKDIPFILKPMLGIECKGNLLNKIDEIYQLIIKSEELSKKKSSNYEIENGFCIRCRIEIDFDRNRPYCLECFKTWASFGNPDYVDNYCHNCGKEFDSTINYPLCDECYLDT